MHQSKPATANRPGGWKTARADQPAWSNERDQKKDTEKGQAQERDGSVMIADFVAESELHAYVDNLLDRNRRKAVERYLRHHMELAAAFAAYRALNIALANCAGPRAPMPAPLKSLCRELAEYLAARTSSERRRRVIGSAAVETSGEGNERGRHGDGR